MSLGREAASAAARVEKGDSKVPAEWLVLSTKRNVFQDALSARFTTTFPIPYALGVVNLFRVNSVCVTLHDNRTDDTTLGFLLDNSRGTMTTDVQGNVGVVVQIGTTPGICL